ncbi:bifunctional diguanylate cyclase/phosphodiesterase [Pseudonocardia sp. KRD291]|uniref:putative bifunctional diguanylate cyclase/phosphodiesterase n=1 Tax=Pseudonocardia sp. KRD291 TaxID=2792007 RepID=UPI001C49FEDF|nr:EAL domain-containing protein [Pseudonocardia sp. KRD291]MBW0102467.1 EAL domain-containing protein [Pseudonocardia sp. KRD291]
MTAAEVEGGEALCADALGGPDSLCDRWLPEVVAGARYLALPTDELRRLVSALSDQFLAAARAERFDPEDARRIGRALVDSHLTEPAVLERTHLVLGECLADAADSPGRLRRVLALQAALGRGYADALRRRTLVEHEAITTAALAARTCADEARWVSEARFSAVFDAATIGIVVFTLDGTSLDANHAACEMVGHTADELRAMTVADFVPPEQEPAFWADLPRLGAGTLDRVTVERPYRRPDGRRIWVDVVVSAVRDAEGDPRYLLAMINEVTERMELQQRLTYQAQHDPLTGLPNRSLFFERLRTSMHQLDGDGCRPRPGICYLDLDGFKVVNDTLGHHTGDRLLQALADRLRDALAPLGHLVARMGGDEFVVLVERSPDRRALEDVATLALETVRIPVRIDDHEVAISASVGVVRHEGDSGPEELMKAADTTLYSAKHAGRGRYAVFDQERHRSDVLRFELSAQMPEALRRDDFRVVYQPLVRLADEQTVGVEALVRWQRPDGELIGPDRFIPLAEETGLVIPLGRRVLHEACRQARTWREAGHDLLVSVNVAARQMSENDLVADIRTVLAEYDMPPERLQLELTERDLMGTPGRPAAALKELAAMGVQIAIDDFGTGYSNLSYLRQLPVHNLKLAGNFVAGSADRDDVILRALVKLARSLDLDVTAEAVETRDQAERLRSYGCTNAQGWYYAPAVSAERIPDLVRDPFVR